MYFLERGHCLVFVLADKVKDATKDKYSNSTFHYLVISLEEENSLLFVLEFASDRTIDDDSIRSINREVLSSRMINFASLRNW